MGNHSTKSDNRPLSLEIVIPVYNESAVIPLLTRELQETFSEEHFKKYNLKEVTYIFVDDGSSDNSIDLLKQHLHLNEDTKAKIVILSRNFGHQAAVTAGLSISQADMIAVMDADLQDPPEVLLGMISKLRQGYDVVYAIRKNRKEARLKVFLYWFFYRLWNLLSPVKLPLDSGDFCLMRQNVVEELNKLPEVIKFPRGLRSWVGFKQTGHVYDRLKRQAGKSKYNYKALYNLATDGIAAMSIRPLQITQMLGLLFLMISALLFISLLFNFFSTQNMVKVLLLITIINLLGNSLIMLSLYILGAYIGRGYIESKKRPSYIVQGIDQL